MAGSPLRVLIAGAGRWGRVHARCLAARPDAELAAVLDIDPGRAAALAADLGGTAQIATGIEDLPDDLDAAIVAVTTTAHAPVAGPLLRRGLPVLVEKPLASTLHDADELLSVGRRSVNRLHVAMVERHNPAFEAARETLGRPLFIQAERLAPFSARSLDIDVSLDLMIHDLDLVLGLVDGAVTDLRAVGAPVMTDRPDMAHVRLEFGGGAVAVLAASRVSPKAVRSLRTFGPDGYHSIDLLARSGHRVVREQDTPLAMLPLAVGERDAVGRQQTAFLDRVRADEPDPDLTRAVEALRLAFRISADIERGLDRWR